MILTFLPIILVLSTVTAFTIETCDEVISYFPDFICNYQQPRNISTQGSKSFLIMGKDKKFMTLKVHTDLKIAQNEVDLLNKFQDNKNITKLIKFIIKDKLGFILLDSAHLMKLNNLVLNTSSLSDRKLFFKVARNLLKGIMKLNYNGLSLTKIFPQDINLDTEYNPIFTNLEFSHDYAEKSRISGGTDMLAPELIDFSLSNTEYLPSFLEDVYSFGLLLYYMKYKKFPYKMNEKTNQSISQKYIYFSESEDKDFIDLIRMCICLLYTSPSPRD